MMDLEEMEETRYRWVNHGFFREPARTKPVTANARKRRETMRRIEDLKEELRLQRLLEL